MDQTKISSILDTSRRRNRDQQHNGCDAEDLALLLEICDGSQDALVTLYRKYNSRVFALIYRITADQPVAEEILQDTFHRLWTKTEHFSLERGPLIAWLFTVARNLALDFKRKQSRRDAFYVDTVELSTGRDILESIVDPGSFAEWNGSEEIRSAMATLPEEQRTVIELAYWEGLTQEELALALGEPLGTIKTRTRLAFRKLRETLKRAGRFQLR